MNSEPPPAADPAPVAEPAPIREPAPLPPLSIPDVVAFVILTIVSAVVAFWVSMFSRFLGYALDTGSRTPMLPDPVRVFLVEFAILSPLLLALAFFVWGGVRLAQHRPSWFFPVWAIVLMFVAFWVISALITA